MAWIVTILVGALIGWLASMMMKADAQMGALWNIVVGILGSLLGAWLFGDVLGFGSALAAGTFSWSGLFWGILGAALLIWILRMVKVLK
ncbi:GlsB/YeaQ/YmgE family stress response membrane protein [Candidatus Berkelbacteria bacterium]|nr:GlsB/YeaQ/YmgE family stress response membrane protein [Candidatus Berkelbacteria bacterium]